MHLANGLRERGGRGLQRGTGREIVGDCHRRKLPLVVDDERRDATVDLCNSRERYLGVVVAGHVDSAEVVRITGEVSLRLEDDAVLVARTVDCRDLSLREGVV